MQKTAQLGVNLKTSFSPGEDLNPCPLS